MDAPRSDKGLTMSSPLATSSSTLRVDKSKGKEVALSPEPGSSTSPAGVEKGKAREVDPPFSSSTFRNHPADEEIINPGAASAAQRGPAGLGNTGFIPGGMGGGMGMGKLGLAPGGDRTPSSIPGIGMGGLGLRMGGAPDDLGGGIKDFTDSRPGSNSGSSPTPRPGTRSGTGR